MDGHLPSLGGLPANHGMLTHQSKDGHPVWPHLTLLGRSWVCLALFRTVWPVWPIFFRHSKLFLLNDLLGSPYWTFVGEATALQLSCITLCGIFYIQVSLFPYIPIIGFQPPPPKKDKLKKDYLEYHSTYRIINHIMYHIAYHIISFSIFCNISSM